MNKNKNKSVSVLEIYATSFSYLKLHFKLYFSIFGIYMLLALMPNWIRASSGKNVENLSSATQFALLLMSLINIKVFMALIVAIKETIAEHSIDLKASFSATNRNFWPYFRSTLVVGLIMFIPNILWILNSVSNITFIKVLMPVLGIIFALALHTYYGFAPEIAVIFDEKKSLFHRSHYLVEGYFNKVILMNLPSILLLFAAFAAEQYFANSILSELIYIINLITVPFFEIATVVMVLKLYMIKLGDKTESSN